MSQQWYVQTPQGNVGPLTPGALRQLAQAGKVNRQSLLSLDGKQWVRASQIKGVVFPDPDRGETSVQPPRGDSDSPDSGSLYEGLAAEHLDRLYPTSRDAEDDIPPLSTAQGLPLRVGVSAVVATLAAAATVGAVRVARMLGLIDLDTTVASLVARVGLPGVAFAVTFALIFWWSGRDVETPAITSDMSDEEIARALKGR